MDFELNGPPQPQMVGFCDLVGVGIAPVSKKNAVKIYLIPNHSPGYIEPSLVVKQDLLLKKQFLNIL